MKRTAAMLLFCMVLAMVVGVLLNGVVNAPKNPALALIAGVALFGLMWWLASFSLHKS